MVDSVFLTIEKGESCLQIDKIEFSKEEYYVGRKSKTFEPDLAFSSVYVSRKHALIYLEKKQYIITDLMSKHGTKINNFLIDQNSPYILQDGDIISLANDEVVIKFHNLTERALEDTLDFPKLNNDEFKKPMELHINLERREVLIDGEPIFLTSKDTELFLYLYQNANKAISYEEIKRIIWAERINSEDDIPNVGREEITALVYRLRKKLGICGQCIITIPRYGYMLDTREMMSVPNKID